MNKAGEVIFEYSENPKLQLNIIREILEQIKPNERMAYDYSDTEGNRCEVTRNLPEVRKIKKSSDGIQTYETTITKTKLDIKFFGDRDEDETSKTIIDVDGYPDNAGIILDKEQFELITKSMKNVAQKCNEIIHVKILTEKEKSKKLIIDALSF